MESAEKKYERKPYVSEEIGRLIEREINSFLPIFYMKYKDKKIKNYNDAFFFATQLLNTYSDGFNEFAESMIENTLGGMIKILENTEVYIPWMLEGYGQFVFAINTVFEKTGELSHLLRSLNDILMQCFYVRCKELYQKPVEYQTYDMTLGLSGVLYYFLQQKQWVAKEVKDKICKLLEVLVSFSNEKLYKKKPSIGFHILAEQQVGTQDEREMKNGHINFGMAHGMLGPLIVMTKARSLGYQIRGLDEAIQRIFHLYQVFCTEENGLLRYPKKLPIEDYWQRKCSNLSINSGWCYGNAGVVRGLMKVTYYMGWKSEYSYYTQKLINIINQDIREYNFKGNPVVCHGLCSIISIQIAAYQETKNESFLKTINRNIQEVIKEYQKRSKQNELDLGVLGGEGGIILTLIQCLTSRITYDRLLLIDKCE